MAKEIIRHPVLQQMIDKGNVPLSLATKGAGLVFVSGLPPVDLEQLTARHSRSFRSTVPRGLQAS